MTLSETESWGDGSPRPSVAAFDARVAAGKADPITPSERAFAAKVYIMYNDRRGIPTEPWIKELAESS